MKFLRLSLIATVLCCAFNACERQPYTNVEKVDGAAEEAHAAPAEHGAKAEHAGPGSVAHPKE